MESTPFDSSVVSTPEASPDAPTESCPTQPHRQFTPPSWLWNAKLPSRILFLLGPWVTYLIVEILNNNNPFTSLTIDQVAFNLIWYYLIFWVLRLLTGRLHTAGRIASLLCFGFGLANHYVLTFRGRIIFPCDLLCLGTAANVADSYDYTPDRAIWIALGILVAYWLLWFLIHRNPALPKGRWKLRRTTVAASWTGIVVFCYVFFFTGMLPAVGIYVQQWKTQANGFLLNFTAAIRYSFVSAPEDYSSEAAQAIADRYGDPVGTGAEPPENLIVIMNESFSDLQAAFPNLELTGDPLEYYHSLTKNTVKGSMVAPVTGGGTANVEFEFLTGDSLAFLPSSTVAYQLYLYDGAPSLVSQAKRLGYQALAFHPYLSSGWNRTSVYPWLGFDTQWYQEDVQNGARIRKYISDASDYEQLYRYTEEQSGSTFVFNVTMQNHSGYSQGWNNLERTVQLDGASLGASTVATQYFSLLDASDDAIRELISHYSASDERTMVVFFGDHQPPLETRFYEKLYGKSLDDRTTEEVLQQYEVPFFIWANYDIPEAQNVRISSNFLGILTAQLAGFPLTGYQQLLSDVMEQLPVATTVGFVTADGTITAEEHDLPQDALELYEDYRLMAYNHLFDEEHHPEGFFD